MKTTRGTLIWALALTLATVLATGCRSCRESAGTAGGESPKPREYTVMTFSGEVDGMSVEGQVRMAKDSVIWCSVSKFIEVGRAKATVDSVWVRVPLLGRNEKGDYRWLKRVTSVDTDFKKLQALLESSDAEAGIAKLARQTGHTATIRIKKRERVERLTFPY